MDILVNLANGFMGMFEKGGSIFVNWVSGFVPTIIALLVAMNAIIKFVGQDRVERFMKKCTSNVFSRYILLPVLGTFFFMNPMTLSLGKFLPEKRKPAYYAAASFSCHTMNGLFPHVNPGELFVFLGIAKGIQDLGLAKAPFALRYFLIGILINFLRGVITEMTTAYVEKQQGIKLAETFSGENKRVSSNA
ncbi:PTS glucitol/sorbitol transporter subunit IIC [Halanaerobacter jeridensis]|uniref:PTS system glucitol/sorbitol-specific IIC component n=1 Tax=Halanaerobacter jeridensis TaxID=706427 RepID=A0A938XX44_9FIRM|nr:PTS glucitol/sorbitol transporter subunit IIC [Halanaerobacter jeridensis]MBM7556905.1 PTS system glucitol/sorbitol-specific IIC component [Halanaerobacter jeridensis]